MPRGARRRRRPHPPLTGSITLHARWPLLRPFIIIQRYGPDTNRQKTRFRIEVRSPEEGHIRRQLLAISMPCVICGDEIHPIRLAQGRPRLYFAATCPLDETRTCARHRAVSEEYERVRAAVEASDAPMPARPRTQQPLLPL